MYAKLVRRVCASAQIEREAACNLEYPWFGANRKTTSMTYFCAVNITGINRNNHDLPSTRRPLPHSDLVPVPPFRELPQLSEDESFMSAIAKVKKVVAMTVVSKQLHIVKVLTRMN